MAWIIFIIQCSAEILRVEKMKVSHKKTCVQEVKNQPAATGVHITSFKLQLKLLMVAHV